MDQKVNLFSFLLFNEIVYTLNRKELENLKEENTKIGPLKDTVSKQDAKIKQICTVSKSKICFPL